jgi:hypothetical protein
MTAAFLNQTALVLVARRLLEYVSILFQARKMAANSRRDIRDFV